VELTDSLSKRVESHYLCKEKNYEPIRIKLGDIEKFSKEDQNYTKSDYEKRYAALRDKACSKKHVFSEKTTSTIHHALETFYDDIDKLLDSYSVISLWGTAFKRRLHGESLIASSSCKLFNPNDEKDHFRGYCFITTSHFCFAHLRWRDLIYPQLIFIKLPFTEVVAVTKAGRNFHHDHVNGKKPIGVHWTDIIPLQEQKIKPSVIQLWSNQGQVHQLYAFATFFDKVFELVHGFWLLERKEKVTNDNLSLKMKQ